MNQSEKKRIKNQIWKHLGRGKPLAIQSIPLSESIGLSTKGSCQILRSIISEMINDDGYAIGSGPKGFYQIANLTELMEVINDLHKRARAIYERARKLDQAREKIAPKSESFLQGFLDFGEKK